MVRILLEEYFDHHPVRRYVWISRGDGWHAVLKIAHVLLAVFILVLLT